MRRASGVVPLLLPFIQRLALHPVFSVLAPFLLAPLLAFLALLSSVAHAGLLISV
jgi:hypothetical protein